jgi:transcriptional regulator with XRE-family HTH domain
VVRSMGPTVAHKAVCNELRRLRITAKRTLEDAAKKLECSTATISRMESGTKLPKARDVRDLCEYYEASEEETQRLLRRVAEISGDPVMSGGLPNAGEESPAVIDMEISSDAIDQFAGGLIPSLFQTTSYMQASLSADFVENGQLGKRMDLRSQRQKLILSDGGPNYRVVIDEGVLRRQVGDPDAMVTQLDYLIRTIDSPGKVELRVLPFSQGVFAARVGSFIIYDFGTPDVANCVYLDGFLGPVLLEDSEKMKSYSKAFNLIFEAALDAAGSRDLLESLKGNYRAK